MAELNNRNLSESFKETTESVIHKLSGVDHNFQKKVIDNVFAFTSMAGGAGTTTLIVNVAYRLATMGLSTLVIDLNIAYPAVHMYYGLDQALADDIIRAINGEKTFGECLQYKMNRKIAFLVPLNRLVIDKAMTDEKTYGKNLSELIEQAASLFDVILIDIPSHGEVDYELSNTALFKSDFIYCVIDENVGCVCTLTRFPKNLNALGIPTQNIKYVMNKRTEMFYPMRFFKLLGIELEALLPYESGIVESALRGQVFLDKGASTSRQAVQFVDGLNKLTQAMLRNGGYVDSGRKKND